MGLGGQQRSPGPPQGSAGRSEPSGALVTSPGLPVVGQHLRHRLFGAASEKTASGSAESHKAPRTASLRE